MQSEKEFNNAYAEALKVVGETHVDVTDLHKDYQDRISALESENAELKKRLDAVGDREYVLAETRAQLDNCLKESNYLRESIAALEDKCLDMELQKVKAVERLAELREAAAWFLEAYDNGIECENEWELFEIPHNTTNPYWMRRMNAAFERRNILDKAETALHAIVKG